MSAQTEFQLRLQRHHDELRWLYMELYDNGSMFFELMERLEQFYNERSETLKAIDRRREGDPGWYSRNDLLGMMLYIDNFGSDINGVKDKLDYLARSNVNYIHLMPFLDTLPGGDHWTELLTGEGYASERIELPAFGFVWLKKA